MEHDMAVEDGVNITDVAMEIDAGDSDMLHVDRDPNTDSSLEQYFNQDTVADEWEAEQHAGVTADMVLAAKRAELAQLKGRNTFEICSRDAADVDKVVGTKWVITNKGTADEPRVKARLVCQEFALDKSLDFFSGTPGLPAVKILLSDVACSPTDKCLLLLDVTGAFLYGDMRRKVGIRLPAEAGASRDSIGILKRSLYGLRDAPQIWNEHIGSTLISLGFASCPTSP